MAACGSLQHIFDNKPLDPPPPLLHPLSSCKHMNSLDHAPPTDVFSGFNLGKKPDSVPSSPDHHHRSISLSSANSESLSEALGFESFDDIEEFPDDEWEQRQQSFGTTTKHVKSEASGETKRSRISGKEIPPPISSIGRRVCFESYRYNGRLILKEVKIPTQELLHAYREDGRLKLQFIPFDDEREVKRENQEKVGDGNHGKNVIREDSP